MPTRAELEASLWNDLLTPWFPACVSPEGGFHQSFAADWSQLEDPSRSLVFQSRMTWVGATIAETDHPRAPEFADHARHGLRFLLDEMRDPETGAFRWVVRREDSHAGEFHAYGQAFAIYALAAAARTIGSEEVLEAARGAFGWLEKAHYDLGPGGWYEVATPADHAIRNKAGVDAIGTPYGQKSQNTHLHLMEAFTELYRVWPDPLVAERLEELLSIFQERLFNEEGWLYGFVEADWTPVPGTVSHGHDVEAAHLLLAAADTLGRDEDEAPLDRARRLVDYALRTGWDAQGGGFLYTGSTTGEPLDATKNWWVQAEGLLALATLARRTGDPQYTEALEAQWNWIREHQIDRVYGGWHEAVDLQGDVLGLDQKGNAWKAAYHDGRALLVSARLV